jgi:hypothetical protein
MSQFFTYGKPVKLWAISDAFAAAFPGNVRYCGDDGVLVADSVSAAAVQAIIAAHDATALTPSEQTQSALLSGRDQFLVDVDTAITAVTNNGWDGLSAATRKSIMLGILKALKYAAKRA